MTQRPIVLVHFVFALLLILGGESIFEPSKRNLSTDFFCVLIQNSQTVFDYELYTLWERSSISSVQTLKKVCQLSFRRPTSHGGPGRRMVFDGSKLGDLVMNGGLESRLKGVDLLSFDLGVER
jgi:hypothetical protein